MSQEKIRNLEIDICLITLNLNGISHIEFSYSGAGDDGAIDSIGYFDENKMIVGIIYSKILQMKFYVK